jgi:hypothetical protein
MMHSLQHCSTDPDRIMHAMIGSSCIIMQGLLQVEAAAGFQSLPLASNEQ